MADELGAAPGRAHRRWRRPARRAGRARPLQQDQLASALRRVAAERARAPSTPGWAETHQRMTFHCHRTRLEHPVAVRVVEYTLADPGRPQADPRYRLITTVLDPAAAPADELAAVYAERWEFESVLDELKTHQRGPRVVLRSKLPDGVRQEAYGYFCVHYAIRRLMHAVAAEVDADPDRLSFTRSLRVARRTTASHPGFSPSGPG